MHSLIDPGLDHIIDGLLLDLNIQADRFGDSSPRIILSVLFCIPTSELTREQVEKKGLQESEIDWGAAVEPQLPAADDRGVTAYREALKELQDIAVQMNQTERARKDIAGWKRSIRVVTMGGQFAMEIDDGQFKIEERELEAPDFVTRKILFRASGCFSRYMPIPISLFPPT